MLLLSLLLLSPILCSELCSNGAAPGNSCNLVPSSGYECKNSSSTTNWCENFNGTYKCCEKSVKKCRDKSQFCRLTKHLCTSRPDFSTMKSKCEATCGFCGINSFDEAVKTEKKMRKEVAEEKEDCKLPRKCVFPRQKNGNLSTTDPVVDGNSTDVNSTTESVPRTSFDLKTILESSSATTPEPRRPRVVPSSDPNDSLKTLAFRSRNSTTSTITLPASFNSNTTARKFTLQELTTTRDMLPKITTAEPSALSTSLSKTVIRGTCFDDYTYCREFTALCSHPAFSEVMASHCELTCGRCDEVERVEEGTEDCVDKTADCVGYRDLCQHSRYKPIMEKYCPKMCGHCTPLCRDRHQNCPQFHDDGFCTDEMYTVDERKYLCGATCLLC